MSQRTVLLMISLAVVLCFTHIPSAFAVSCGDVIMVNTTLDTDLSACTQNPALEVQGGVELNLNGHTVSCDTQTTTGITLTGQRARLRNGSCRDAG